MKPSLKTYSSCDGHGGEGLTKEGQNRWDSQEDTGKSDQRQGHTHSAEALPSQHCDKTNVGAVETPQQLERRLLL